MKELIKRLLGMDDCIELMPVVISYFKILSETTEENKVRLEEMDEAIEVMKTHAKTHKDMEGLISYYVHEIELCRKTVIECINTVQ